MENNDVNQEVKKEEEKNNGRKRRIIIYIIIIIIIILSLLTSCGCTSRFLGKLNKIINSGDYVIDNGCDKETIRNQDLRFDEEFLEMSLSDSKAKLSFTYENISPDEFFCNTSDASIATCYVSKGYVVVIPKMIGEVIVTLHTTTNGKIYEATAKVSITDVNRYIDLSSSSGTINLNKINIKRVSYDLVGLAGEIKVVSSDPSIATGVANNGVLKITGYKAGTVTLTLTLTYNGLEYTKIYTVTVTGGSDGNGTSKPSGGNEKPGNNDKPSTGDKPNTGDNPNIGDNDKKSNDTSLKQLTVDGVSVIKDYYIRVDKTPVKLIGVPNDNKAVIIYKGQEYKSLEDIPLDLKYGDNEVTFTVKAEDGTTKDYTVTIYYSSSSGGGSSGGSKNYYLDVPVNEIELRYTNNGGVSPNDGERTFIIKTPNLFTYKVTKEIYDDGNGNKGLKLCSKEDRACVYVSIPKEYEKYIELDYDASENGPPSLAIRVKATMPNAPNEIDIDNIPIKVWGEKNGNKLPVKGAGFEKNVILDIIHCYVVSLNANGGVFDVDEKNTTTKYRFEIAPSKNEFIELKNYIPYIKEQTCVQNKFSGYSTSATGEVDYYKNTVIYAKDLKQNLHLFAIYSDLVDDKGDPILKVSWVKDIPIFDNKEAEKLYNDNKLIYPGATGNYKMNFKNESKYTIYLESMILKEETICVDTNNDGIKDGCVNMGYIVSVDPEPAKTRAFSYYLGNKGRYEILNLYAAAVKDYEKSINELDLDLTTDLVGIPSQKGFTVDISWKWIDEKKYDKLDTLIGQAVAKGDVSSDYKLDLGIKYYTLDDVCKSD